MRHAALLILVVATLRAQSAPDAATLLNRRDHALDLHQGFQFQWRAVLKGTRPDGQGIHNDISGSAFGRPDGRSRLESSAGALVISDGKTTWTFHPAYNTYNSGNLRLSWFALFAQAGVSATPAIIQRPHGDVREEKIDVDGQARDCWVVVSVAPSPWRQQTTTWIDKKLWIDWRIVTNDHEAPGGFDIEMTLEKFNLTFDPALPDSLFTFTPPAGAMREHHEGVH